VSPVSASHSKAVYDALEACGVRIVSALPETWLVHLSGWRRTIGDDAGPFGEGGRGAQLYRIPLPMLIILVTRSDGTPLPGS
jgi:hypothetical protein